MEVTGVCPAGFPHSEICGSKPTCGSPQLFAAGRVLLRQMVPWHPPCALRCLISFILRPFFSSPAFSPSGYFTFDWSSRKTHFSSVQLSRFGAPFCRRLQGNPENDTASKFSNDSLVLFALPPVSSRRPIDLGSVFRLSPSDFSLERR